MSLINKNEDCAENTNGWISNVSKLEVYSNARKQRVINFVNITRTRREKRLHEQIVNVRESRTISALLLINFNGEFDIKGTLKLNKRQLG